MGLQMINDLSATLPHDCTPRRGIAAAVISWPVLGLFLRCRPAGQPRGTGGGGGGDGGARKPPFARFSFSAILSDITEVTITQWVKQFVGHNDSDGHLDRLVVAHHFPP